ncbi:formyltransferase family protein [Pectobacterium brasiliense]|uniref:formyltransferase family protein n=1 Tax=Pectobacterium brasiliense TaxID=180957 RepID=UPI000690BE1B|nr:formyltransferase family protein [Pectobacterium brasiliense]
MRKYKVVLIGSTGGGVFSKIAQKKSVRDLIYEAISDRDCGFLSVAESFGLPAINLGCSSGAEFSRKLIEKYSDSEEFIFLSFYTKIFTGRFVEEKKIFNCHPSLLPLFKGMNGFEDTFESSCKFMGSTIHLVDEGIDTGEPLIQAVYPLDRSIPSDVSRHKVFLMQYYSVLQFFKWLHEDRISFSPEGNVIIKNAVYTPSLFSPCLDDDFFDFFKEENILF